MVDAEGKAIRDTDGGGKGWVGGNTCCTSSLNASCRSVKGKFVQVFRNVSAAHFRLLSGLNTRA